MGHIAELKNTQTIRSNKGLRAFFNEQYSPDRMKLVI
jgi:secreted Zn-dependent insulinase-like peptidase